MNPEPSASIAANGRPKSQWWILCGIGLGLLLALAIGKPVGREMLAPIFGVTAHRSVEAKIAQTVEALNKELPRQVNSNLRLERVYALSGRRLRYHYTFLDQPGLSVSADTVRAAVPRLTAAVCLNMQVLLKEGVTVSYIYTGSDDVVVGEINISQENCG